MSKVQQEESKDHQPHDDPAFVEELLRRQKEAHDGRNIWKPAWLDEVEED